VVVYAGEIARGRRRDKGRRGVYIKCVSVRGGKRKKERGVGQGVFECVRWRDRETKRASRERVRGRGGRESGEGRCMRERDSEREGEGGGGGERVRLIVRGMGETEGREGREI
jgi:hypothetical protein